MILLILEQCLPPSKCIRSFMVIKQNYFRIRMKVTDILMIFFWVFLYLWFLLWLLAQHITTLCSFTFLTLNCAGLHLMFLHSAGTQNIALMIYIQFCHWKSFIITEIYLFLNNCYVYLLMARTKFRFRYYDFFLEILWNWPWIMLRVIAMIACIWWETEENRSSAENLLLCRPGWSSLWIFHCHIYRQIGCH